MLNCFTAVVQLGRSCNIWNNCLFTYLDITSNKTSDRENPNFMTFKNSIKSKDLSLLINDFKNCDICC